MKGLIVLILLVGACRLQPNYRERHYAFVYQYNGRPVQFRSYDLYECRAFERRAIKKNLKILRSCYRLD